jgi:hypothetical protein
LLEHLARVPDPRSAGVCAIRCPRCWLPRSPR